MMFHHQNGRNEGRLSIFLVYDKEGVQALCKTTERRKTYMKGNAHAVTIKLYDDDNVNCKCKAVFRVVRHRHTRMLFPNDNGRSNELHVIHSCETVQN